MSYIWNSSRFTASINENNIAGASLITFNAIDNNLGTNALSYSLMDDANGYFSLNQQNGRLSLLPNHLFDYETQQALTLVVRAHGANDDGTMDTISRNFVLKINNLNDNVAQFANAPASRRLLETSALPGASLANFSAVDADRQVISYSLTGTDSNYFNIDSTSGVLSLRSNMDVETTRRTIFSVTVKANSQVSADGFATADSIATNFILTIRNENDTAPVWSNTPSAGRLMNENNLANISVAQFGATDPDGNFLIDYSVSGSDADYFRLDGDDNARTLVLVSVLDAEVRNQTNGHDLRYSVVVKASQTVNGNEQGISQLFILTVGNIDDNQAAWVSPSLGIAIDEAHMVNGVWTGGLGGTAVATFNAVDADGQSICYWVSDQNGVYGRGDAPLFSINDRTGVLQLVWGMEYEHPNTTAHRGLFTVLVNASSNVGNGVIANGDANHHSGNITQLFILTLNNVNDNPLGLGQWRQGRWGPYFTQDPVYSMAVNENNNVSSLLLTSFDVSDPDSLTPISLSIYDDASSTTHDSNYFSINQNGQLYWYGSALDYETSHGPVYSLVVQAISGDGSSITTHFVLSINNVNEPTVWANNPTSVDRVENFKSNQSIAQFSAYDLDGTGVSYWLDTRGGDFAYFSINSRTGKLSFKYTLSYDELHSPNYSIVVGAWSGDGQGINSITRNFVLHIKDQTTIDGADADVRTYDNLINNNANDHDYLVFTNLAYHTDQGDVTINNINSLRTSFESSNWYFVKDSGGGSPQNHWGHIVFDPNADGDHNVNTGTDQQINLMGGGGDLQSSAYQFHVPESWANTHALTFDEFLNLIGGQNYLSFV